MAPPILTIDAAYFAEQELPALEQLLALASHGEAVLRASQCPYDANHQPPRFVDICDVVAELDPLPSVGQDLPDEETYFKIQFPLWHRGGLYTAKFSERSLSDFKKLCRQVYGTGLKPYQEYRAYALFEHKCSGGDWFVTCDEKRLLGRHAKENLALWSIRACSPSAAVEMLT